ncbi:MAG: glutamine synthetase family protein [Bacteroidota bacterium]|nr:glutamine synthetase family protein [Bacteroidota bacterium]
MYSNELEKYLKKPAKEFTKSDIIKFVTENDIKMLNFRYVGGDSRLKKLSFVIDSIERLDNLLSMGERLDGSSIFDYIEADASDLYIVPKYQTAFVNPFEEDPTLDIICKYYTVEGKPLKSSPANIMLKAQEELQKNTGYELQVMGELEFYIIGEKEALYPATDQHSYHESPPFSKWRFIVDEAMKIISSIGGKLKYGHSEVGSFTEGKLAMEQYELEFLTAPMEESANQLILAKWILRMLGYKYGLTITFAPKITVGKAGCGLHIHTKLLKDGKSVMIKNNKLSDEAKKIIAGYLDLAPALSAFGNTIPTSYLRLVPHQEAPTNICWGDRNRSVLVRVPLGWLGNAHRMIKDVNPQDDSKAPDTSQKQTAELRSPDGSADIYLLMAGLAVAARHGLEMDNALEKAKDLYVNVNIFDDEHKDILEKLDSLPTSCFGSAKKLLEKANVLTKYNVFSQGMLEDIAEHLKSFDDEKMSEELYGKNEKIKELVNNYLHYA